MDGRKIYVVPESYERDRADRILSSILGPSKSRSSVSLIIKSGRVESNGSVIRPSTILEPGDRIGILEVEEVSLQIENDQLIELRIIFENDELMVLDKPAGLITHPGAGRTTGTLVDLALKMRPEISGVGETGRWGIAHRLDKDTSGVIVIAKTNEAYERLVGQFKERRIHKVYRAIVRGNPKSEQGVINSPIGRDSKDRKKMTTNPQKGRAAQSYWEVLERFEGYAYLEVRPETGRTHQIRAHLTSINTPILGDKVYGAPTRKQIRSDRKLAKLLSIIMRQALHALAISIPFEDDSDRRVFSSDLPQDMQDVLRTLRELR